jgi:hypothetical protein
MPSARSRLAFQSLRPKTGRRSLGIVSRSRRWVIHGGPPAGYKLVQTADYHPTVPLSRAGAGLFCAQPRRFLAEADSPTRCGEHSAHAGATDGTSPLARSHPSRKPISGFFQHPGQCAVQRAKKLDLLRPCSNDLVCPSMVAGAVFGTDKMIDQFRDYLWSHSCPATDSTEWPRYPCRLGLGFASLVELNKGYVNARLR